MRKSKLLILLALLFVTFMTCTETEENWTAEKWNKKAAKAYSTKSYDEAIKCYKKALAVDPNNVKSHCFLGWIYETKDMFDEAILEYKKALAINPDCMKAHYNLGVVYGKQGQNTLAANHLYEAGFLAFMQGKEKVALKAYRSLEGIGPQKRAQDLYELLAPLIESDSKEK